jgi:hypothetical protein
MIIHVLFMNVRMGRENASAMTTSEIWRWSRTCTFAALLGLAIAAGHAATASVRTCQRVELQGEVSAGQEWRAAFGQGWVFRVLPIAPSPAGYSGWDLAVDRDPPAGYPDALLLATLPYNSINEREIGTTFGLRAQDAIGWNPRSFRFLTNPVEFGQAQSLLRQLAANSASASSSPPKSESAAITQHLLRLESGASSGQFRILDARLAPGIADPQPFAQAWAFAFSRAQHEVQPVAAGQASPQGKLVWIRFALTLWLPSRWKFAPGIKAVRTSCPQ